MGILRGLRRSRVFLIHRLIAGTIALTLFLLCVNSVAFDRMFLSMLDAFGVDLHDTFNVASSIDTLKGVLIEGIPKMIEESDMALAIALSENSKYLGAVIGLIYNLIFGLVCFILYAFIKAVLFIFYCLFYPEWKYRIKYKKKVQKNIKKKPYKTRRLAGGLIGACCSLLVAFISFSFLGNMMYMFAGTGEKGLGEYNFSDSDTNDAYKIVNTVESYGSKGIFKFLNLAKDKNGVPLYLYAGGLMFSGEVNDQTTGESERVFFTHEMGSYTTFLKETASLAIEYNGKTVDELISGDDVDLAKVVSDLFTNKTFKLKFRELISEFTAKSTFVNEFVFDVIDSYCANIDKSSFSSSLSEDAIELMEIMFVKGYISPVIYFEEKYIESNVTLPYVKLSDLISRKDILVVYDIFTDLVDAGLYEDDADVVDLVVSASSHLEQFLLFNKSNPNKKNINGVLGRLYSYAEIKLLGVSSTSSIETYTANQDVKWTDEIIALTEVAPDMQKLYHRVKELQEDNATTRECFSRIFDDPVMVNSYDTIVDYVSNSLMVGRVMDSEYVFGAFEELMLENVTNYSSPKDVTFNNYVNSDGDIVHGELYNFLVAIKNIGMKTNTRELLINVIDENTTDLLDLVKDAESDLMEVDSYNKSTVDYVKNSAILRSVTSAFIIDMSVKDQAFVYIPDISREKDAEGNYSNIIKKEEFDLFIDSFFTQNNSTDPNDFGFISLIPDGASLDDEKLFDKIIDENANLFENKVIYRLVNESYIFQANFGKFIIDNKEDLGDVIVLPDNLHSPEYWVAEYTVENNQKVITKQSEAVKVFDALHELFETSKEFKDIDAAFDKILKSDKLAHLNYPATEVTTIFVDGVGEQTGISKTEVIFNSGLLRATISDYICDNLPESFPNEGIEAAKDEQGIVTIEEFSALVELLDFLNITDVTNEDSFNVLDDYMDNINGVVAQTAYGIDDAKNGKLIDLVYQSSPVKYYFSDVLDDALVECIGEDDPDKEKLDYVKDENNLYSKDEAIKVVNSIIVCDTQKVDEANDKVIEAFQHFNDDISSADYPDVIESGVTTRLDVFYNSNVMIILLTDSLQEQIEQNDMLQDHPDAMEEKPVGDTLLNLYRKEEISYLVDFIDGKSIDDSSADKFDSSDIEISRVKDNFFDATTKQCYSKLLLSSISLNVIENEAVTNGSLLIPSSSLANIPGYSLLKDAELYNILAFSCDLGISNIDSVNDTMQDDASLGLDKIKPYIQVGVQNTDVIRATVSDRIINTDSLSVPVDVLDTTYEDCKVVDANEMSTLFNLVEDIGINNMSGVKNINVDEITLSTAKSWINDSKIIHATTSVKIISNSDEETDYLIIPVAAKLKNSSTGLYVKNYIVSSFTLAKDGAEDRLIVQSELNYLFDALESINIDTIADAYEITEDKFDPANYTDNQISAIALSSILRATVTQNVRFIGDGNEITPKALDEEVDFGDEYTCVKQIADNKIAILHDHEVDHLLKAMRVFKNEGSTDSAFTCKFTVKQIKQLQGEKLDTILDSDIFRVAVSDSVIPVLDTFSISYTTVSPKPYMYCFELKIKTQFDVLSKTEINRCIGLIPDGSL